MNYAEASYDFEDGTPVFAFAHIAARDEANRLKAIDKRNRTAYRAFERRTGSRRAA